MRAHVEQLGGDVFRTQMVFHTSLRRMEFRQRRWNRCGNVVGTGKKRDDLTVAAPNFEARVGNMGHTQTSRALRVTSPEYWRDIMTQPGWDCSSQNPQKSFQPRQETRVSIAALTVCPVQVFVGPRSLCASLRCYSSYDTLLPKTASKPTSGPLAFHSLLFISSFFWST